MNRLSLDTNLSIGTFLILCRLPTLYLKSLNEFISIFHLLVFHVLRPPFEHPTSNMSHKHKLSRAGLLSVCAQLSVYAFWNFERALQLFVFTISSHLTEVCLRRVTDPITRDDPWQQLTVKQSCNATSFPGSLFSASLRRWTSKIEQVSVQDVRRRRSSTRD